LRARPHALREEQIAIAELHLAWLEAARAAGPGACRAVMFGRFREDVPLLSDEWIERERELATRLLGKGAFAKYRPYAPPAAIPDEIVSKAAMASGIDVPTLQSVIAGHSSARRCDAQIALLQAVLDQRDTIVRTAFYAFYAENSSIPPPIKRIHFLP